MVEFSSSFTIYIYIYMCVCVCVCVCVYIYIIINIDKMICFFIDKLFGIIDREDMFLWGNSEDKVTAAWQLSFYRLSVHQGLMNIHIYIYIYIYIYVGGWKREIEIER